MTDDDFSELLLASFPKTTKILLISDCCHSGSIADFSKPNWKGRRAISISGCRHSQTSGDTGNGGICTHAILLAVESLQSKGETKYSVGKLFNETLRKDDEVFNSPQDITIDSAIGVKQNDIDWPLVPKSQFTAPHGQDADAGMYDGPAPANTYTLQSSVDGPVPAKISTSQSSMAVYATATDLSGNNSYYLPSARHDSASFSQSSSLYVVQTNHYDVQAPGPQLNPHLSALQPIFPGQSATEFANPGHTAFFMTVAHCGRHPGLVNTNFAPLGSMALSPGPALLGNVSHMTISKGVSIQEPAPHLTY